MNNTIVSILFFAAGYVIAIALKTIRDRFLVFKVRRPKNADEATDIAGDLIGKKMCELIEYTKCVSRVTSLRASVLLTGLSEFFKEAAADEASKEIAAADSKC